MKQSFDKIWEQIHSTQEWGQYPNEYIIRFIARNYYKGDRAQTRILDFGCGGGAHTWYLAREGFDTYAFDGSKSAVEKTKLKLEREGLDADIKCLDANNIDYPDEFFDAVVDNLCIYGNFMEDIEHMYKDVFMKLKNGGKIISVCFGKNTYGYGYGDEVEPDTYENISCGRLIERGRTHFWDVKSLEDMLSKSGFKDIQIDTCVYTDRGEQIEHLIATAIK